MDKFLIASVLALMAFGPIATAETEGPFMVNRDHQKDQTKVVDYQKDVSCIQVDEHKYECMLDDVARDYIVGEGEYDVSMSAASQPVRFADNARTGVAGIQILDIDDGSLFHLVGLQNNDILVEIDGVKINDMEQAMKLYKTVKDYELFTYRIMRIRPGGKRWDFKDYRIHVI